MSFICTNCCRIFVALAVGTSFLPLNPTLHLLQKLHMEKLVELCLVPFFEHVSTVCGWRWGYKAVCGWRWGYKAVSGQGLG